MNKQDNYIDINKQLWNERSKVHFNSEFYDMKSFRNGDTSLKEIELAMLGDIQGKSVLHLQCHFGQDTLSLARMGADACGVDFSETSIQQAKELAAELQLKAEFICCDVYDLNQHTQRKFDLVFTSYGTIGWLPDINRWAKLISDFLKPGGKLVFAEFHPYIWMYDNELSCIQYNYFKDEPIVEFETGTYADRQSEIQFESVSWNHSLSEVFGSLLDNGLQIKSFKEYDYSPYNFIKGCIEVEPGRFRIEKYGNKIPLVYSIEAVKI